MKNPENLLGGCRYTGLPRDEFTLMVIEEGCGDQSVEAMRAFIARINRDMVNHPWLTIPDSMVVRTLLTEMILKYFLFDRMRRLTLATN